MKILFLTRRFWPEIGGVERHTLEVASELIKLGHQVEVVCEMPPQNFQFSIHNFQSISNDQIFNIKIHRIPVTTSEKLKKFWIWGWLWKHRELIKEADIIHAHDVGFWYWPFRFFYPQKAFFMTFHGYEQYPLPFKNKIIHKISEKMARGNICVGDFMKKWYGTKADYVTYGGVDVL